MLQSDVTMTYCARKEGMVSGYVLLMGHYRALEPYKLAEILVRLITSIKETVR